AYASACNNPYYYNSYENNSVYYGPRGSISSNVSKTTPSPRASLGEKYQKAIAQQSIPTVNAAHSPVSGTGRPNPAISIEGSGKQNVSPVVTPKTDLGNQNLPEVNPVHRSISDKNLNGTKPVA